MFLVGYQRYLKINQYNNFVFSDPPYSNKMEKQPLKKIESEDDEKPKKFRLSSDVLSQLFIIAICLSM